MLAWFAVATSAPVSVPELLGLTTADASQTLADCRLIDGRADFAATRVFPPGAVVAQSPVAGSAIARGSAIGVKVAVAPRQATVPDVGLVEASVAERLLRHDLFEPALLYSYNKDVPIGLVIEQLPRAGDVAITGSPSVLVVSLGPGSGGKGVPDLLGKRLGVARSELTSATLFAEVRGVIAKDVPDGTVVDQAPSADAVVPETSNVTLSVAISRATTP
jgi:serine/threonine-protein kinase